MDAAKGAWWMDIGSRTSIKVMLLEPALRKSMAFFPKSGIHATTP